jgi:LuxR family maltose regulon positive regulatory protein
MHDATHLPLLLPKVRPPRSSAKLVPRPRLGRHAASIEETSLTVVSAPSGFGKTTIGAVWARELRAKDAVVGWLALDQEDNELTRFLQYLAFSIGYAYQDQSLQTLPAARFAPHPLQGYPLISNLINHIAEEGSEFFLFLDDFHLITQPPVKDAVRFLLRNAPSNFHMVLLSRPHGVADFDEGKPGSVLKINAGDLRFTEAETRELFGAYSKHDKQASIAHALTGGWAAALRIMVASNAICGRQSPIGPGSDMAEDGMEKLLGAVLAGLNREQVRLVEMTCIVGRMCGPLFVALTGIAEPRALIDEVEHKHNLLAKVTEDGYWFCCHDLTRESVTRRLLAQNRDYVVDIASRASQWYAAQGYWSEAVNQALAADNIDMAIKWIEACAPRLAYKGDLLTLLAWENRLQLTKRPTTPLRILRAIAMVRVLTDQDQENASLSDLIELIDSRLQAEPSSRSAEHDWHLQAIRAIWACRIDDLDVALTLSVECLEQPIAYPALAETLRSVAAYSFLQFRQWTEFYQHSLLASKGRDDEYSFMPMVYQQILLAIAEITQLHLDRAQRHLEEAQRRANTRPGSSSVMGALCSGMLGLIHYEKLELPAAEAALNDALDLVPQTGYIDVICSTYTAATNVAALRQENEYALSLLEKWERTAALSGVARLQVIAAYEKVCFFLREKGIAQARASLIRIRDVYAAARKTDQVLPAQVKTYVELAEGQFALASGRFEEARQHFDTVYQDAVRLGDVYSTVLSAVPLAYAEIESGRREEGIRRFDEVIAIAQPIKLKGTILSQPVGLMPLIAAYKKHAPQDVGNMAHMAFVNELADAGAGSAANVAITLSPREVSVLQLVAQDKSNKEISLILKITPETVKTHVKSIFLKLNVSKRNAAVRRAASLGLLHT